MRSLKLSLTVGLLVPVVYVALLGAGLVLSAHAKLQPGRSCFAERLWEDTPGLRPCVRITRIYEDGSFKVAVSDGNGTVRYSMGVGVPDSYECSIGVKAACR